MDAFLSAGNGVNFTSSTSIEVIYFPVRICFVFVGFRHSFAHVLGLVFQGFARYE
jgi:hypothetical protein